MISHLKIGTRKVFLNFTNVTYRDKDHKSRSSSRGHLFSIPNEVEAFFRIPNDREVFKRISPTKKEQRSIYARISKNTYGGPSSQMILPACRKSIDSGAENIVIQISHLNALYLLSAVANWGVEKSGASSRRLS